MNSSLWECAGRMLSNPSWVEWTRSLRPTCFDMLAFARIGEHYTIHYPNEFPRLIQTLNREWYNQFHYAASASDIQVVPSLYHFVQWWITWRNGMAMGRRLCCTCHHLQCLKPITYEHCTLQGWQHSPWNQMACELHDGAHHYAYHYEHECAVQSIMDGRYHMPSQWIRAIVGHLTMTCPHVQRWD